jgi:hypothetical protein
MARTKMAPKKPPVAQDSFLNTVARTLGHAAGTLTKITQGVTDNVSTLPQNIVTRVNKVVNTNEVPEIKRARRKTASQRIRGRAQARSTKRKVNTSKRAAHTRKRVGRGNRSRVSNR